MTDEDNGIKVIYSRGDYGTDKKNMKASKTDVFKFPVVHSITLEGLGLWYTSTKTPPVKDPIPMFGVPKVLLNANENQYSYPEQNDFEGKYGMSQLTFGIPITSKKQGDDIVNAINTDAFKEIIKATKWATFQTDWHMFKYFKPDFYKSFLGKSNAATKIQAVTRGKQTCKKINTTKKGGYRKNNTTKRKGHRKTKKAR